MRSLIRTCRNCAQQSFPEWWRTIGNGYMPLRSIFCAIACCEDWTRIEQGDSSWRLVLDLVESCLGREDDRAPALTNSGRRNQRRRERARRRRGTEEELAGQPARARTERRTETRSPSKH